MIPCDVCPSAQDPSLLRSDYVLALSDDNANHHRHHHHQAGLPFLARVPVILLAMVAAATVVAVAFHTHGSLDEEDELRKEILQLKQQNQALEDHTLLNTVTGK